MTIVDRAVFSEKTSSQEGSTLGNIPWNCIHLTALIFVFKTQEVKGLEQGHRDEPKLNSVDAE